jgi:hypothetical protein
MITKSLDVIVPTTGRTSVVEFELVKSDRATRCLSSLSLSVEKRQGYPTLPECNLEEG